jgi:hypothetical protein
MKLRTRIERLEGQLGIRVFGGMPIAVFRRWIGGTISEEELECWGPAIEEMLAGRSFDESAQERQKEVA